MTEILNSSETLLEKRACVAALMDEHPDIFARPTLGDTWMDFAQQNKVPDDHEQRVIDQATGRIHQIMRAAQDRTPPQFDMKEMLNTVRDQGIGDFEADPRVLEIASPDATAEEIDTMARAMALYKEAIKTGAANGGELHETLEGAFGELPAETPFMRALVDTAKRIVLIDLRHAMQQD